MDQIHVTKRLAAGATPGRSIAKSVVGESMTELQKEIEVEKRRNLVLRSLIDGTAAKIEKKTGCREKRRIARLQSQIEALQGELVQARQELEKEQEIDAKIRQSQTPEILQLQSDVRERRSHLAALRRTIENIDEDIEIMSIKERQQSLLRMRNNDLSELHRKHQRCVEVLEELLEESERQKAWKLNAARSMLDSNSSMRRRLQCLMRRYCALNSMIEQLTEGKSLDEMAENSNRKMRNRLRAKIAEVRAACK